MKPLNSIALLVAMATGSAGLPKIAYAQAACLEARSKRSAPVSRMKSFWIDLNRGRYYHKAQSA
jgi:hypothetical protein